MGQVTDTIKYPLKGLKLNSTLDSLVVFVEYKEVKNEDNNQEYLEVIYLKDKPKRITSKENKIILDINEYSKYPEVPSKLYQLMKFKDQMVIRDQRRTGLVIVSL